VHIASLNTVQNIGVSLELHNFCARHWLVSQRSMLPAWMLVCLCLSVCVHTLKLKRIELSTPNLVHIYSVAVAQHALIWRSKGQRSRSHGCKNRHDRMATVAIVLLMPAWDCTSYDCLGFYITMNLYSFDTVGWAAGRASGL